jgi:hypothetical protein
MSIACKGRVTSLPNIIIFGVCPVEECLEIARNDR